MGGQTPRSQSKIWKAHTRPLKQPAIEDRPEPTNITELQSFLEPKNHSRDYVNGLLEHHYTRKRKSRKNSRCKLFRVQIISGAN